MIDYQLKKFDRNASKVIFARREISFEVRLTAQMILDEICFQGNKARLDQAINQSLDQKDKERFQTLSKQYSYIWN